MNEKRFLKKLEKCDSKKAEYYLMDEMLKEKNKDKDVQKKKNIKNYISDYFEEYSSTDPNNKDIFQIINDNFDFILNKISEDKRYDFLSNLVFDKYSYFIVLDHFNEFINIIIQKDTECSSIIRQIMMIPGRKKVII